MLKPPYSPNLTLILHKMVSTILPALVIALCQRAHAMQKEHATIADNGELTFAHSQTHRDRHRRKWGANRHIDIWKGNCSYDKYLNVMDFKSNLAKEMMFGNEFSVGFPLHAGCSSHFYHLIINYAVPLFAKTVEPFKQNEMKVPSTKVHVYDAGGVINLLQDMVPDINLTFGSSVCECCQHTCKGATKKPSLMPNYAISSDWFIGRFGYEHADESLKTRHRKLMLNYRRYILQHYYLAKPQTKRQVALIGRRDIPDFEPNLGLKETGAAKRSLQNGQEVALAIDWLVKQVPTCKFKKLYPEDYSFKEQVKFFTRSNMLIGVHGAGMAQCMWMPSSHSTVLTITGTYTENQFFSWLCGEVYGHRYYEFVTTNNLMVQLDEFTPMLRALLNTM